MREDTREQWEKAAGRILRSKLVREGNVFTYSVAAPYAKMNANCTRKLLIWMVDQGMLVLKTNAPNTKNYYYIAPKEKWLRKPWRAHTNDFLIGHVDQRIGAPL